MSKNPVGYLKEVGVDYKSAESPDLWIFLENHFAASSRIGPKFSPLSETHIADLIARTETALLEELVTHHQRTGRLQEVSHVLDLPYVVGRGAYIPLAEVEPEHLVMLIDQPGSLNERVLNVLPVAEEAMPRTQLLTVTGGLYPDGHTAGLLALYPGRMPPLKPEAHLYAYLATKTEINALVAEMQQKLDEISVVTRQECGEMLNLLRAYLKDS